MFARFGREADFEEAGQGDPAARLEKRRELARRDAADALTVARGARLQPGRRGRRVATLDPALSQRIARAWADSFIAMSMERRLEASKLAREFLEKRIEALRGTLEGSGAQGGRVRLAGRDLQPAAGRPGGGELQGSGVVDRSPLTDRLETLNQALRGCDSPSGSPRSLSSLRCRAPMRAARRSATRRSTNCAGSAARSRPNTPRSRRSSGSPIRR